MKRVFVLGASSGVGRAIVEGLAKQSATEIIALARDLNELSRLSQDCFHRWGAKVHCEKIDLNQNSKELSEAITEILVRYDGFCELFLVAGTNLDTDKDFVNSSDLEYLTRVNYLGPALVATEFLKSIDPRKKPNLAGRVVFISTIASQVPRRSNLAYAAAKNALESFAKSLRHVCAGSEVKIQIYRLGYVDTALSFGKKLLFPVATPEYIATRILEDKNSDFGTKYLPGWWCIIVMILRSLPWLIYQKMRF